jgi:lipid II isoglutaminyl synthase (glutamine-hydrolysing)
MAGSAAIGRPDALQPTFIATPESSPTDTHSRFAPRFRRARRSVAIATAQLVAGASRAAGHEATSLPGLVAEALAPDALRERAHGLRPVALVTGTNGKTTTARLLARIVGRAFEPPVVNASGANLRQSIVSTVLLSSAATDGAASPGVFEVDELALPDVVADVAPTVIVVTNLFRDQLDRFGEVDRIVDRWRAMLARLDRATTLVYCADDPRLTMVAAETGVRSMTFGLDWAGGAATVSAAAGASTASPTPDPVSCYRCGAPLEFEMRSIGHLGRFSCPNGHVRWRAADVRLAVEGTGEGSTVRLAAGIDRVAFGFQLSGLSFGYDAAAAGAGARALGIRLSDSAAALTEATAAFGRSEAVDVDGRRVLLSLAKNPASLAEAAALAGRTNPAAVVVALNDHHADGRDVSWIWDADVSPLLTAPTVVFAGERAADLGLRAKYDEAPDAAADVRLIASPDDALAAAVAAAGEGETVLVVATYTALLAIRGGLVRRGLAAPAPR